MPAHDLELIRKLEDLQAAYIVLATNDEGDANCFDDARRELLNLASVAELLPEFVHRYRTRAQFWQFVKRKFPTYAERRQFIWDGVQSAIEYAEGKRGSPADLAVQQGLASLDATHIHDLWTKALQRRSEDPEGAITAARTLLESVCKLILDEAGEAHPDDAELPKLYSQTAKRLNLAPSQHTEQIFKQILGGCQTVVDGVGAIRNRLSDAHGKGKKPIKPAPRHAELVVNLAGAMAVFLAATWIQVRNHA
jgi:abortive infection Abi-like protein